GLQDLDDAVAGDRGAAAQLPLLSPLCPGRGGYLDELGMARSQRRQVEAIGLGDAPLVVAPAVALAVGAVLHADQAGLDQPAVERLDLSPRQAERLLLRGGRRPDDRPPTR